MLLVTIEKQSVSNSLILFSGVFERVLKEERSFFAFPSGFAQYRVKVQCCCGIVRALGFSLTIMASMTTQYQSVGGKICWIENWKLEVKAAHRKIVTKVNQLVETKQEDRTGQGVTLKYTTFGFEWGGAPFLCLDYRRKVGMDMTNVSSKCFYKVHRMVNIVDMTMGY